MTQIADDRSWWADVEHLRPGAVSTVTPPSTIRDAQPSAAAPVVDLDGFREDTATAPRGRRFERDAHEDRADTATLRRTRITGRSAVREDGHDEPVLRRADAASFADAMDLDGAFGAPARAAGSREIVLTGLPVEEEWVEEQLWDEPGARRAKPSADLWDDGGDLWEEPARRKPDPSQAVLWDDDELWVQPARRRGPAGAPAQDAPRSRGASGATRRTVVISYDPDRVAMWAVVLGILLVLIAASSSLT